ncbi:caspase family protein [Dinoroseobacter sp. S76]|uniref:caspase family protein n=1 Tax=Dinoroseobacter sp. S76 TaxID=3415124 RepID=UPI003C7AF0BE
MKHFSRKAKRWASVSAVLATLGGAQAALAEDRAIIIGINEYKYLKDADLKGATVDARRFRDYVRRDLGLADRQISMLLDGDATRDNIIDTIVKDLRDRTNPGDRLILFFAGHGASTTDRDGDEEDGKDEFIVAADRGKPGELGIILDDELRFLLEYFQDREILVVVDACYSGTIARNVSDLDEVARTIDVGDFNLPPLPDDGGHLAVASRSAGHQTLVPGQAHMDVWSAASSTQVAIENRKGGVFTTLFLEGARDKAADANRNGVVSNAELLSYVQRGSANFCRRSRLCQTQNKGQLTPSFSGAIERTVAFTSSGPDTTNPVVVAPPTPAPVTEPAPPPKVLSNTAPEVTAPETSQTPTNPVEEPETEIAEITPPTPQETSETPPETNTTPPEAVVDAPVPTVEAPSSAEVTIEPAPTPDIEAADAPVTEPTEMAGNETSAPPAPDVAENDPPEPPTEATAEVEPDPAEPDPAPKPPEKVVEAKPPVELPDLYKDPPPLPVAPLDDPFICADLQYPSGTARLEDMFLPSQNAAVDLSIRQGVDLEVDQTVLFDVATNRGGRLVVYDLTPGCELYQIFPSVISPAKADRLNGAAEIEIPSALSANGQPMVIRVTKPAGRGHLLAVLVEDTLPAVTQLTIPQSQMSALPDGLQHLTDLANGLNAVVTTSSGARSSQWHATILPYVISE